MTAVTDAATAVTLAARLAHAEEDRLIAAAPAMSIGDLQADAAALVATWCPPGTTVVVLFDHSLVWTPATSAEVITPARSGFPWGIMISPTTHPSRPLLIHEVAHVVALSTGGAHGHGPDFRAAYGRLLRGEGHIAFAERHLHFYTGAGPPPG